jgi:AraC family transcriptional regulator
MSEHTSQKVEPRIVSRNAFLVAGLRYEGKNQNREIPAMWEVFLPRMGEFATTTLQDYRCYGVCRALPDTPPSEGFEYLACVEVPSLDSLPPDMVGWEVPALTYAVLPANDVAGLGPVCDYFYGQWIAASSAYALADGPMFEEYPPEYPTDPTIYLYFPVQHK